MTQDDSTLFADAESRIETARFYLLGVRYDLTCSHRRGCADAPKAIREESYNFETYFPEYDIDLEEVEVFDAGDLSDFKEQDGNVLEPIASRINEALERDLFPITIGGEHTVSIGAIMAAQKKYKNLFFLSLDAHADYRNEYLGNMFSHACVSRRAASILGPKNVAIYGVRSISREEVKKIQSDEVLMITAKDALDSDQIPKLKNVIGDRPVYLSLDIDVIDPAYAPGVGNPEPFGLSPSDIRDVMVRLKDNIVGFDVVEINPKYDTGNTAALGARLIREMIALKCLEP